jgi:hypothetical protein
MPADLDTAFDEIAEGCCFDWPKNLAVERLHVGIAEILAAAFVFAGFVVRARQTICMLILDQSLRQETRAMRRSLQDETNGDRTSDDNYGS